ncbi:unnamed protein product [Closterium sp. NIES-54]
MPGHVSTHHRHDISDADRPGLTTAASSLSALENVHGLLSRHDSHQREHRALRRVLFQKNPTAAVVAAAMEAAAAADVEAAAAVAAAVAGVGLESGESDAARAAAEATAAEADEHADSVDAAAAAQAAAAAHAAADHASASYAGAASRAGDASTKPVASVSAVVPSRAGLTEDIPAPHDETARQHRSDFVAGTAAGGEGAALETPSEKKTSPNIAPSTLSKPSLSSTSPLSSLSPASSSSLSLSIFTAPTAHMLATNTPMNETLVRRSILSWLRLRPTPQVYLLGDHPSLHNLARQFPNHVHVEPRVESSFDGVPLFSSVVARAEAIGAANSAWRREQLKRTGSRSQQQQQQDVIMVVDSRVILLNDVVDAARAMVRLSRSRGRGGGVLARAKLQRGRELLAGEDGERKRRWMEKQGGEQGDWTGGIPRRWLQEDESTGESRPLVWGFDEEDEEEVKLWLQRQHQQQQQQQQQDQQQPQQQQQQQPQLQQGKEPGHQQSLWQQTHMSSQDVRASSSRTQHYEPHVPLPYSSLILPNLKHELTASGGGWVLVAAPRLLRRLPFAFDHLPDHIQPRKHRGAQELSEPEVREFVVRNSVVESGSGELAFVMWNHVTRGEGRGRRSLREGSSSSSDSSYTSDSTSRQLFPDSLPLVPDAIPPFLCGRGGHWQWLQRQLVVGRQRVAVDATSAVTAAMVMDGVPVESAAHRERGHSQLWLAGGCERERFGADSGNRGGDGGAEAEGDGGKRVWAGGGGSAWHCEVNSRLEEQGAEQQRRMLDEGIMGVHTGSSSSSSSSNGGVGGKTTGGKKKEVPQFSVSVPSTMDLPWAAMPCHDTMSEWHE